MLLQKFELFSRFNAFGGHPHMQTVADANHRAHDIGIIGIAREISNE